MTDHYSHLTSRDFAYFLKSFFIECSTKDCLLRVQECAQALIF